MNRATRTMRLSFTAIVMCTLLAATWLLQTVRADDDNQPPATRPASRPSEGPGGRNGMPPRGPGGPRGGPGARTESLEQAMGAMNRAFNTLKKQIKDPTKNESSLTAVNELERATAVAKGQLPDKIKSMPKDDQAAAIRDYKQMMIGVLKDEVTLEEQLMDGKNDKAAETFNEINDLQNEGHKEYRPERGN
jgi:soluble cytochrome b562